MGQVAGGAEDDHDGTGPGCAPGASRRAAGWRSRPRSASRGAWQCRGARRCVGARSLPWRSGAFGARGACAVAGCAVRRTRAPAWRARHGRHSRSFTAWPPNCWRSAASTLAAVALLLAAAEARQQRERDDRRRHVEVDGLLDRPATLAGVRDPAADVGEVRAVLLEGEPGELQQPRADDRAVLPGLGHGLEVERVLRGVEDLEALGVGLHQAVLDAVVDHLGVVPGARRAAVDVAALRRQRQEDRLERRRPPRGRRRPSCRSRSVRPQTPPRDARVDEVDAALREQRVAPLGVLEVGVAAVDDGVARARAARRTPPCVASVASPAGTMSQTMRGAGSCATTSSGVYGALEALGHDLLGLLRRAVEGDHAVPGAMQAARHVAAHAAESDDDEVHAQSSCRWRVRARQASAVVERPRRARPSPASGVVAERCDARAPAGRAPRSDARSRPAPGRR